MIFHQPYKLLSVMFLVLFSFDFPANISDYFININFLFVPVNQWQCICCRVVGLNPDLLGYLPLASRKM